MKFKILVLIFIGILYVLSQNLSILNLELLNLSKIKTNKENIEINLFENLVKASNEFNQKIKFPTQNNRIINIAGNDKEKQSKIIWQAKNTYPIFDKKVIELIKDFINYKKESGSSVEKLFYSSINVKAFIQRLLLKRPIAFLTSSDTYLLQNGQEGAGGLDSIGKDDQKEPLVLRDYISYDEMQISALIGVSVPTYFINNGSRDNNAKISKDGTFEPEGIYVGLVGARFERPGLMEWQHIIITQKQNTIENGYGLNANNKDLLSIWARFYETKFPTFEEAEVDKSGKYLAYDNNKKYFNIDIYKKRMRLVIKPFLIDANKRGQDQNKKVYVHVVGLGTGAWAINQIKDKQEQFMLEVFYDLIKNLDLTFIADLDFSWIGSKISQMKNNEIINGKNKIKIHYSKRNPADKLSGEDAQKVLVASYAWDGNSYPGNEYWLNALSASGDPAAACCSTIAELQNPQINTNLLENVFIK